MLNPAPKNVGGRVPKPSLILTLSPQGCDKGRGLYRWPETTNIYKSDAVLAVSCESLPSKSVAIYEVYFNHYKQWCDERQLWDKREAEDTLLVYFSDLLTQYAVSSCWTRSSALKLMLFAGLGDRKLPDSVTALLRARSRAHNPKKSLAFSKEQVEQCVLSCFFVVSHDF